MFARLSGWVRRRHQWVVAYVLLAPYLVYAMVFWVYPFVWGGILSLQRWVIPTGRGTSVFVILNPDVNPEHIGLGNFTEIVSLKIAELPRRIDTETGQPLYVCGRKTVTESEIGNYEGSCEPRYVSVHDVVPRGYSEWFQTDLRGLLNKRYVVASRLPLFWNGLVVTLKFFVFFMPMVTVGSLLLAMALQRARHLQGIFIAGYLSSYVVAGVAYSAVFKTLFARNGLVDDTVYRLLGTRVGWFSDTKLALFSIAAIVAWKFVGYYGLIFLSGLNAIPKDVYEAANLDGANAPQRFFRVTIPLLNPALVVVLVFGTILSFNIFTEPYLITGGTPDDTTNTFMLLIYRTIFEDLRIGLGAAMAIVMAALSFLAMTIVRRLVEREVAL
jgi:multiple sugar transport system permease protein